LISTWGNDGCINPPYGPFCRKAFDQRYWKEMNIKARRGDCLIWDLLWTCKAYHQSVARWSFRTKHTLKVLFLAWTSVEINAAKWSFPLGREPDLTEDLQKLVPFFAYKSEQITKLFEEYRDWIGHEKLSRGRADET
jgi:hypothetical protein